MTKENFDILTDYEELCGRLKDILIVLGMTSVGEDSEKDSYHQCSISSIRKSNYRTYKKH